MMGFCIFDTFRTFEETTYNSNGNLLYRITAYRPLSGAGVAMSDVVGSRVEYSIRNEHCSMSARSHMIKVLSPAPVGTLVEIAFFPSLDVLVVKL